MNEILYCIINQYDTVIARDLNIDNAMIFVRALLDYYFGEEEISYSIKRQKEDIPQPSPCLYAISQTASSGEVYYRDFKNNVWKKHLDEYCLCSEKSSIKNSWEGDYELLTVDLNLRLLSRENDCV
jgi:hypothetical protein